METHKDEKIMQNIHREDSDWSTWQPYTGQSQMTLSRPLFVFRMCYRPEMQEQFFLSTDKMLTRQSMNHFGGVILFAVINSFNSCANARKMSF